MHGSRLNLQFGSEDFGGLEFSVNRLGLGGIEDLYSCSGSPGMSFVTMYKHCPHLESDRTVLIIVLFFKTISPYYFIIL